MRYGIIKSSDLGQNWSAAHHLALATPRADEAPLAMLLAAINQLVKDHADDYVLREGLAHLLMGVLDLLNWDFGRIDRGRVNEYLNQWASDISFNLEIEEFTD